MIRPVINRTLRHALTFAVLLSGALAVSACNRSGTDPEGEGADRVDSPTTAGSSRVEQAAITWERYVVVLPFENLGEDGATALVAGLTEEIRARIAALPSVAVISADQVGLNVLSDLGLPKPDIERYFDLILAGSIRWAAGKEIQTKIRIAERGWEPGVWNREWRDPPSVEELLATQSEIAAEVRRILDLPDADLVSPERTDSIEAYEAYLRGLSMEPGAADRGDREAAASGIEESVRWLSRATREDSGFSLAHALLSERHSELYRLGTDRSDERLAEAKAAVDRAVGLEPGLPEAQRALGLYHLASGDYERALEALAKAALEMPDDGQTLTALGLVHWNRGELERCEGRWKQAFRLSANGDLAFRLGRVAERLGDDERARRWFEYADRLGRHHLRIELEQQSHPTRGLRPGS